MVNLLKKVDVKKTGIFAAGVLFGTAGIKILSSKDAKKVYTNCTAAVLRAKECVMKTVTNIQENAEDILEEAKQINDERAEAEITFEDEVFDGEEETPSEEDSCLYLAIQKKLAAVICIEDSLREEAETVINSLRMSGISKVVMMTGDSEKIANVIAKLLV